MAHNSNFDPNAFRKHLLSVAIPYSDSLKARPGLMGIMLYGSLVRGSITPFSDIDIAAFYEADQPCGVEHRTVENIKVDIISFSMRNLTSLLQPIPRSFDVGFPMYYAFESLLLAGDNCILFDPTGELLRVKTRLCEETSFHALNLISLSEDYHKYYRSSINEAGSLLEQGDYGKALGKAKWAGELLAYQLMSFAVLKDTRQAAELLGIDAFADKREGLALIAPPTNDELEAIWAATQSLWNYSMQAAAGPLKECLRAHGVAHPDQLEMVGNYDLFWPGHNLYEYGRLMKEVNMSIYWCRCELDRGAGEEALGYLWACRGTQGIRHRWQALSDALKDTGYNCSAIIEPILEDYEFTQLSEHLDRAMIALDRKDATPEAVRQALALANDMERILTGVIPLMSEAELTEWKNESKRPAVK